MKSIKKALCFFLTMLFLSNAITPVFANDNIKVKIDGNYVQFDVQPQIINDRTMVPLRAIFEALGASVNWDGNTQTVTSSKDNTTIKLTINAPTMYVNNNTVTLDAPACLIDGRTLVPVRAISEAFNLNVNWDSASKTVIITADNNANENNLATVNVHPEAFDKLKNILISTGLKSNSDGNTSYSIYDITASGFNALITYKVEENEITLFLTHSSNDTSNSVIVIINNNEDPSAYQMVTLKSGKVYTALVTFPINRTFTTLNSSFPTGLIADQQDLLNSSIGLLDTILKLRCGMTFADFGMHYDKN